MTNVTQPPGPSALDRGAVTPFATPAEPAADAADARRTLLLVVGSGRSGTSVIAGLLARLRFWVPQPEVAADDTNPRGFGEPQWVVDFHNELLRSARVLVTDARPGAWSSAGQQCFDRRARATLHRWLKRQFSISDNVLVKDPRLLWFIPLWRQCADDLGANVRFLTMLRHPAEVVSSKERWYDGMSNPAHRLAGWVNTMLYTERATRDQRRAYVLFGDLLEDWTRAVATAGNVLGLDALHECSTQEMADASAVIDTTLYRSRAALDDLDVPADLRTLASRVWDELTVLADPDGDRAAAVDHLDRIRQDYVAYYGEIEAVAHSTILAAHRYGLRQGVNRARTGDTVIHRLIRVLPTAWRDAIPIDVRRAILRALRVQR